MLPAILLLLAAGGADLVDIRDVNPRIRLDIRYATMNNFTRAQVYDEAQCFLQADVARRLSAVDQDLKRQGLGLKVYDCYRPLSVQKKFWALVPDERYVANPAKGSRHNRGASVDLTLVDAAGREVAMPTPYDDFTAKAHRDARDVAPEAVRNREILEKAMVRRGFLPLPTEWWHFDAPDWERYPVLDIPFAEVTGRRAGAYR
ncbi:MAG TPA: M15 family metallopeptidase [Bryobacteraceae bacterium]|nr:M15 family metallopeptidase [Bryobacteraceae bacterium]